MNTYQTGSQSYPAVAADGVGRSVVVWSGDSPSDSDASGIRGQRYDSTGALIGGEFQVNTYTTSTQNRAAVAADSAGNFVVVWHSSGSAGSDTDGRSIQVQRYDSGGTAVGGQFQVNTYTTNVQVFSTVAADAVGNVVVAWVSSGSAGSDQGGDSVQAQRFATGRPILGKKLLLRDPNATEQRRSVLALGKETATDIGPAVLGDPTTDGATLRVIAKGTTDSEQSYVLDASGWSAVSSGFRYVGPTGGDGDPVKQLILKRTASGKALVKALLKGNLGTQSLDAVPPNQGDEGGIILTINGGGTYCVAFGGVAGGDDIRDDQKIRKLQNATAGGCPTP